jgi:hypothetical protein
MSAHTCLFCGKTMTQVQKRKHDCWSKTYK